MDKSSNSKSSSLESFEFIPDTKSSVSNSSLLPTMTVESPTVTNASLTNKTRFSSMFAWDILDSLFPLLQTLKNLEQYQNSFILINEVLADNWKQFVETAQVVRSFQVNEATERNDGLISASVFIRLAQLLKGEPLLPSLRELRIVPKLCPSFQQHLSLLVSPSLKTVKTEAPQGAESRVANLRPVMKVFLADLALHAPNIEELYIGPGVREICLPWLTYITSLRHLRELELRPLIDVTGIESLRPMKSLVSLEVLWLEINISPDGSSDAPARPIAKFLPSLTKLDIKGPLGVVSDFLNAVSSVALKDLIVTIPLTKAPEVDEVKNPDLSSPPSPLIRVYKPSAGLPKKKKSLPAPSSLVVLPPPVTAQDKPSDGGSVSAPLKGRWSSSLEEISVTTGNSCTCDLSDLSELRALRKLSIQGSQVLSLDRTLAASDDPTLWTKMTFLQLPSLSLSQLGKAAKLAPLLDEGIFHLGLEKIPDLEYVRSVQHPLSTLTVTVDPNGVSQPVGLTSKIKVARYLNMLFPGIKSLKGPQAETGWSEIQDLVKLCQDVRKDDQCRILKPTFDVDLKFTKS